MLPMPLPIAVAVILSGLIWSVLWIKEGDGLRQTLVRGSFVSGMWVLIVFLAVHTA